MPTSSGVISSLIEYMAIGEVEEYGKVSNVAQTVSELFWRSGVNLRSRDRVFDRAMLTCETRKLAELRDRRFI